jgi:2'-5' RNA ligase
MTQEHVNIAALYEGMWEEALGSFQAGVVQPDPYLTALESDVRRGMALIARVPIANQSALCALIDRVREAAPDQHYYRAEQFHATVLPVIATVLPLPLEDIPLAAFIVALQEAFDGAKSFDIELRGITASPSVVMVQGYPDAILNHLRECLREALQQAGLAMAIEPAYKRTAAHITLMRFSTTPASLTRFTEALKQIRQENLDFGTMRVEEICLTYGDYYLTPEHSQNLHVFPLG